MGTREEGKPSPLSHALEFEFNDSLIPRAVSFWIRLVEDRLAVSLFPIRVPSHPNLKKAADVILKTP